MIANNDFLPEKEMSELVDAITNLLVRFLGDRSRDDRDERADTPEPIGGAA